MLKLVNYKEVVLLLGNYIVFGQFYFKPASVNVFKINELTPVFRYKSLKKKKAGSLLT